ncbi:hypothetical protein TeGR_g7195, partial [Tetraparma gracilis]
MPTPEQAAQIRSLHAEATACRAAGDRAGALQCLKLVSQLSKGELVEPKKKEGGEGGAVGGEKGDEGGVDEAAPSPAPSDSNAGVVSGVKEGGVADADKSTTTAQAQDPPPQESADPEAEQTADAADATDATDDEQRDTWYSYETDEGNKYFYNRRSRQSVWEEPEGMIVQGKDEEEEEEGEKEGEEVRAGAGAGRRKSASPDNIVASIRRRSSAKLELPPAVAPMQALPATEEEAAPPPAPPGGSGEGKWVRCRGVTFGDGTGEDNARQEFFRNSSTGETMWEQPEGWEEAEEEEEEEEGASWEKGEGWMEELENLTPLLSGESPLPALRRLCDLSQSEGTEEEWKEGIGGSDMRLAKILFGIVARGHDPRGKDYSATFG